MERILTTELSIITTVTIKSVITETNASERSQVYVIDQKQRD